MYENVQIWAKKAMMVADVRLVTMRSEIRFEKAMKISIRGFPIHHFQAEK